MKRGGDVEKNVEGGGYFTNIFLCSINFLKMQSFLMLKKWYMHNDSFCPAYS